MIRLGLGLGLGLTQRGITALPPEPVIDGAMSLVIDTDLASGTTIELPLSGTVDCTVHWGDWSTPTAAVAAGDVSHTYARPGEYTIQIEGDLTSFGDGATWTGADMLTSVTTFGTTGCVAFPGAFYGATSLTVLPESVTGVTDISDMLHDATSYNGTELATWDITSLTDAANALDGCGLEPDHYNQIIMSWADQVATNADEPASITLGADGLWWGDVEYADLTHADTDTARSYLTTTASWTISGDTEAMVLVFDTSKEAGTTVELPLLGAIDCTVYWGDDSSDSYVEANSTTNKAHTWAAEGTYTVMITGSVYRYGYFAAVGNISYVGVLKLLESRSFGNLGLNSIAGAYCKADNITYIPKALPSSVKGYHCLLTNAKIADASCIENIELWDTQYITQSNNLAPFAGVGAAPIDIDLSNFTILGQDYIMGPFMNPTFTTSTVRGSNMWEFANYNTAFTKQMPLSLSNISELGYALNGCTAWNHSLADMQLRKAGVDMRNMLNNCGMSVENYSRTLIEWANYVWNGGAPNGPFGVTLGAQYMAHDTTTYGSGHFTDAATARAWLTTAVDPEDATVGAGWNIQGDFRYEDMTTLEFVVTEGNLGITLDPRGTELSYRVDNGDGSAGVRLTTNGNVSRTLAEAGTFEVKVAGNYQQWGNTTATANIAKLSRVLKISESVTALPGAWRNATSLTTIPSNVDWVTDVSYMLSGAATYAGTELATWDVTKWTNAEHVLDSTAISIADYDTILAAWAATVTAAEIGEGEQEITVGVNGLVYSAAAVADIATLATAGWTFVGHTQETP